MTWLQVRTGRPVLSRETDLTLRPNLRDSVVGGPLSSSMRLSNALNPDESHVQQHHPDAHQGQDEDMEPVHA